MLNIIFCDSYLNGHNASKGRSFEKIEFRPYIRNPMVIKQVDFFIYI